MTTKFKKSNINIQGKLWINIIENDIDTTIGIDLNGLKHSKSGVYCLRNKLNSRLYIGMARNLEVRKQRHTRDLRNNQHCSKSLQLDFDELVIGDIIGVNKSNFEDIFEFEVIIYCYLSELTFWEKILIDNLHPYYNVKKKKEDNLDVCSDDNL